MNGHSEACVSESVRQAAQAVSELAHVGEGLRHRASLRLCHVYEGDLSGAEFAHAGKCGHQSFRRGGEGHGNQHLFEHR